MERVLIKPQYKVLSGHGFYGIYGRELTSGEEVTVNNIPADGEFVAKIADLLNRNSVSVHHAKDVIRDMLIGKLEE